MNYTVTVNEAKKEIKVVLDGYEGVARCCPSDHFNLGTGIELALERAKVAKANAEKPKVAPSMSVSTAIDVLERHVGNHIAIIGGGKEMSELQKAELRRYADMLAPEDKCTSYEEGYTDGYDKGVKDTLDDLEREDEDEVETCAEKLAKAIVKILYKLD